MKITPEECAEIHRNDMGYNAAIYNKAIELFHAPSLAALISDFAQEQKAIASLPAILTLVAEQQKEIKKLKGLLVKARVRARARVGKSFLGHDAHIKREALKKAVGICESIKPLPTYKDGGTATCEESSCYDKGVFNCVSAIRKEMEACKK